MPAMGMCALYPFLRSCGALLGAGEAGWFMSIMIIIMYAKINFARFQKKRIRFAERSSVSILRTTLSILMSTHTVLLLLESTQNS